ncbi:hypothetical protein RI367_008454 [Sorochytrium milnesiophthora]
MAESDDVTMSSVPRSPSTLDSSPATERETATERNRQFQDTEMEPEIDTKIDSDMADGPTAVPTAVYFIVANELGERLCYYSVKPLLNIYLQFIGSNKDDAKILLHSWQTVTYSCPLLGAVISDSYLGKYRTILYLSVVYLIGNVVITLTSIKAMRSLGGVAAGLYLLAIGTGGIKSTVGAHAGDQLLKSGAGQFRRFFSYFYLAINVCKLVSTLVPPMLKDSLHCFGDAKTCYFAAFLPPTVAFAAALGVFVYGKQTYRIVPPTGSFLPGRVARVTVDAVSGWLQATASERSSTDFWQFGRQRHGETFAAETGELWRMVGMLSLMPFVWMCYDQSSSEWQDQYLLMTNPVKPEMSAWAQLVNSILVIVLVGVFGGYLYPALECRGIACSPLRRIGLGSFLVTVAFGMSGFLHISVVKNFNGVPDPATGKFKDCTTCVNGLWQLPQWIVLSVAEALFSPTANEFAYTQVSKSMKSIASGVWLFTIAIGNLIVVAVEESLKNNDTFSNRNTVNKYWLYTAICAVANVGFVFLAHLWYKYKPGSISKVAPA